jgi:hypothetical protein
VDPRIVDRYHAGETVHHALARLGEAEGHLGSQGPVEAAVLDLLAAAPAAASAA